MTAAAERLRARIDQRTLWEVEADIREVVAENDRLRTEVAGLRQEVVDARSETTAEMARADLAEARRDEARETIAAVRTLAEKWGGEPTSVERFLANAILAIVSEPTLKEQP